MSSVPPPPPPPEPQTPTASPPAAAPPPPPPPAVVAGYAPAGRRVPESTGGVFYSVPLTILLMIVTFGIWGFFWTYRTSEDMKKYNGDGLGGVLGVVIYLLLSVV